MKLLLKQVTISDTRSPYSGLIKDVLVSEGFIEKIEDTITSNEAQVVDVPGLFISPGWVDIFAHFNDPGIEYKETIESGAFAAAAGGYTHVFVLPNTQPSVSNKTTVEYIVQKSRSLPVNILPIGSITKNAEGKELAEMYDMFQSGAVAFSDGLLPVQTPGLLLKALQYVKAIEAVIIQLPIDKSISKFGLVNEGITSTRLGLPGIPAIAEELMVTRDIELAKYTGSKLHITGISTAKSLEKIKAAKDQGLDVTCSVTPFHLAFCDEDLSDYDTNLKTDPPLRSRNDMMALRHAVEEGTIDCIATHHLPQNWDNKTCEFEYAAIGMIGLETTFSVINSLFANVSTDRIINLLCTNPRKIFNIPQSVIKENASADFTIFDRNGTITFNERSIKSKSKNSPFLNQQFKGTVVGIVNKDKVYLND